MAKKKNKKSKEKAENKEVNEKQSPNNVAEKDSIEENSFNNNGEDQEPSKEELLQQKVDELNDKFLRLYSEYDNYRKRTAKEKLDLVKTASVEVISDLLPVVDDMERAINSSKESEECDAITEGFRLIHSKMRSILEKKGLKPIESVGQPFDTDFHEAITYIPAPSEDLKGKVVEEVEKGYTLNEKVIRYTKAVIGH